MACLILERALCITQHKPLDSCAGRWTSCTLELPKGTVILGSEYGWQFKFSKRGGHYQCHYKCVLVFVQFQLKAMKVRCGNYAMLGTPATIGFRVECKQTVEIFVRRLTFI